MHYSRFNKREPLLIAVAIMISSISLPIFIVLASRRESVESLSLFECLKTLPSLHLTLTLSLVTFITAIYILRLRAVLIKHAKDMSTHLNHARLIHNHDRELLEDALAHVHEDIETAELQKGAQKLRRDKNYLRSILQSLSDNSIEGVRICNSSQKICHCNSIYTSMAGETTENILGRQNSDLFPATALKLKEWYGRESFQAGVPSEHYFVADNHLGRRFHLYYRAIPIYNSEGGVAGLLEIFQDLTAFKIAEKRLMQVSTTDTLTGLNNRQGFLQKATQQLILSNRHEKHCHLIECNIQGLHSINDKFGFEIGDEVLYDAGQILKSCFRESDTIGRLDGDTFVVLTTSEPETLEDEEIVNRVTRQTKRYLEENGTLCSFSFTFSVMLYKRDKHHSIEQLLRDSESYMKSLKDMRKKIEFSKR